MSIINTHVTLFPPFSPLLLALPSTTPLSTLHEELISRLPPIPTRLHLTTTSGRAVPSSATTPLSSLSPACDFLTLRLSAPLCGGKGGFGSQLRAAGGRMSSRKKSQENNDSCRNLSGRRLRTVKEAKALAAYLEIKPEMDKKEKEEKKKRWREIVEAAEKRDERAEGAGARIDDHRWVEEKEEGRERVAEAVKEALGRGLGLVKEEDEDEGSSGESSEEGERRESEERKVVVTKKEIKFAGWDEDDEFMSSDEEDAMSDTENEPIGKGKGKAIAAA